MSILNSLHIANVCYTILLDDIYMVVKELSKKRASIRLLLIIPLIIGICLEFLMFCLYRDTRRIFWVIYLIAQIIIWISLGFVLGRLYMATYRDELTDLWNRRYLYIKLDDEMRRVSGDSILSLVILDVDNFKCINDRKGHLFGDAVLREIAIILQRNIRQGDVAGRWGGEEFIIILPNTDKAGAKAVCERIRDTIENYDFGCKITISAGLTSVTRSVTTNKLIEMADYALYEAKKIKNTIAIY